MKFPGGNPLLFCEQVGTVTSFFEQWNDCERTVVLYALLKRVPFANLKFLQLSIDYNLAQNYSSQSKLQLLESHANNANFLNKLVQRYQQTTTVAITNSSSSSKPTRGSTPPKAHNNSSCNITNNNNLTISDAGYDSEKTKSSTFDLSSTSSLSCSTTSGLGSSSSSSGSDKPAKTAAPVSPTTPEQTGTASVESKKDILNDMLTYLPLLKPGNDDVKSVYMSLIPAAVEDACQQHVPTELVQHILSYLLIHPAVNNDDRRSLSYWLRHLEEHIATSYIPTTLAAATTANNNNNNNNTSNIAKHANSGGNYFTHNQQQQQQQHLAANSNTSKPGSQQSLQFLATGPWQHHIQQHQQQHPQIHHPHQLHSSSGGSQSGSCNQLAQLPPPPTPAAVGSSSSLISISNSSLLSRSQQSLNQTTGGGGGSSSSSSSSSCLDSTSSQLLKTSQNSSAMVMNLDWTTSTEIAGTEEGGGGGGGGGSLAAGIRGSMENLALKEFGSVSFNFPTPPPGTKPIGNGSSVSAGSKHHHLHQSAASNVTSSSSSMSLNGSHHHHQHHPMVLTADLDSSDDNHLSFSKNGTEIFDYDCDYDNEEEFNYLARAAAAVAVATTGGSGGNAPGGATAAGSAVTPGTTSTAASTTTAATSKNRVSFDANINDYLRVPPIGTGDHHHLAELDGASGLLKTRRSNSLTTTMSGVERPVVEGGLLLHQHQKQNNECLSAENLSNLQLLQNKPRSFSLTMESPRSSLTSSGSETRLDDFKQHHHMMKMYGQQPNVGMASIAHWLKSLRLHKYVWLFSNLTYEQMMEMTEEYLASLGVTKGARHKLVLCIQKLRERHGVMLRLEKDLLTGSKATLGPVFEELTNIVLTPMKPVDPDDKNDLGTQFLRLMDLVASLLFTRPTPQDEEYLNVYIWLLERALHNEAFCDNGLQLKELKYKASKLKMSLAPKSHYPKSGAGGSMNGGGINKPRWSVSNKHNKPEGGVPLKTPHRKSSLQYFSSPMTSSSSGAAQQPPSAGASSSSASHTHLQAIPPHQYYGTGHNNSYNKSSSYPNFASNLSGSGSSSGGSGTGAVKHQQPHPSQQPQQQPPHHPPGPSHVSHGGAPGGNFMYHRHSLNNISAHQHQQQFLQHLQQNQQQQPQLLPSIYLSTSGAGVAASKSGKVQPVAVAASSGEDQKVVKEGKQQADLLASKSQNNSIGDINSRLEFLCLQMTEQAIN